MLKRNFFLLIIILVVLFIGLWSWAYFFRPAPGEDQNGGEVINFIADFLPFMGDKNEPAIEDDIFDLSGTDVAPIIENNNRVLRKVSSFPVSGFGIFDKARINTTIDENNETIGEETNSPYIKYVNKLTGNIYETFIDSINEVKKTTTTVPLVHESLVANDGKSVVMRYLNNDGETLETFLAETNEEGQELKGAFLPQNITNISISPDKSKLFYLLNTGEESIGTILDLTTGSKTQVFDSSFTDWVSSWGSSKSITLTTKASASTPGYVYSINPDTKNFSKLFGGINGLTVLPNRTGTKILYTDSSLVLSIYDTKTGESSLVGLRTLPEKCAWKEDGETLYCAVPKIIPTASYPDSWYRGEVSFVDELWRINTTINTTTKIIDLSIGGEEVDAIKPTLSSDGSYLVFMNKADYFVWRLELE